MKERYCGYCGKPVATRDTLPVLIEGKGRLCCKVCAEPRKPKGVTLSEYKATWGGRRS